MDNAGKAVQDAGKQISDAGKKAVDAAGQTVGEAGDAASKAVKETQAQIGAAAKQASEALGEQFSKAKEQAIVALKNVKGAPDLLQKVGEVFPNLQQTLAGITDTESAQKALPMLENIEGMVSKLTQQFGALPDDAKKTIGSLIQKGSSSLQPLMERVLELPAVQAIRPKLESIMNKLKDLGG